jgi:hypothetical protein
MLLFLTGKILTSVVSYPDRGAYGDATYRGNCTGYLILDLLRYYKPKKVLDPMQGSGTCWDVCKELNIPYVGSDLALGMDMFSKDFLRLAVTNQPIDFIFWHPPYGDMIRYSQNSKDLSTMPIPVFRQKLISGAQLLYKIIADGGHLAILIGTLRRQGKIYRFNVDLINWQEPTEPEIIKVQHNCASDKTNYSGKFIPIVDERVLIWKKS